MEFVAWSEIRTTLTESPLRTLAAVVLLVSVGLAISSPTGAKPVAQIGDETIDLDQVIEDLDGVSLVSADESDSPAITVERDQRAIYQDKSVVHALSEEDHSRPRSAPITQVSGQRVRSVARSSDPPVWLLGILDENE